MILVHLCINYIGFESFKTTQVLLNCSYMSVSKVFDLTTYNS